MSAANGYDARGEDTAIRAELADLVDHQARTDGRVTDLASAQVTTLDRVAVGLGRISTLEGKIDRLLRLFGEEP